MLKTANLWPVPNRLMTGRTDSETAQSTVGVFWRIFSVQPVAVHSKFWGTSSYWNGRHRGRPTDDPTAQSIKQYAKFSSPHSSSSFNMPDQIFNDVGYYNMTNRATGYSVSAGKLPLLKIC